jgi:hypothetical protein
MSSWKKVKGLFWQSGTPEAGAQPSDAELSDAEFAELLATSPHAVARDSTAGFPGADSGDFAGANLAAGHAPGRGGHAAGAVPSDLDFQAQYDAVGIPNTDEVEQLESFLSRLDNSLPQSSKLAAARAFLGAIGKSKDHVLEDAGRKIQCVRSILAGKHEEVRRACISEQQQIDALQAQIEQHRQRMEAMTLELEGIRQACLGEESRLQAARVFFGSVEAPGG